MEWLGWLMLSFIFSSCLGENEKLFVKYGVPSLDPLHVDSFFELRRMRSAAEADGWALAEDHIEEDGYAILCRNKDYRVCLLYDGQGAVAGIQVSFSVEDVKRSATPYPMDLIPMQKKKRIFDTDVYSATAFFVDDGVLKSGGRVLTDETKTAPNGVYFFVRDDERRFVPTSKYDLEGTLYRQQGCRDAMGRHYFYNLTMDLECGELETFAPIYDEGSGELAAVTYFAFGRSSVQRYGRRWWESAAGPTFKHIAPDSPNCLPNWIDTYGLVVLHIYVHNEPWKIKCTDD